MASAHDDQFQPPRIPIDSDSYVKCFSISNINSLQAEEARTFFDQFGFVVFENVFSSELCSKTIDDIWNVIESFVQEPVRHDESKWTSKLWCRTGLVTEGIIGDASLWTRQILLNRQNPALHAAFACILGTENLLVNHDRYGMFRPAKQFPQRKTMENLHLDMNPWSYVLDKDNSYQLQVLTELNYDSDDDWIEENNETGCAAVGELHVQGQVNLADNLEADGGFWLVPGFHKYLAEWAKKTQYLAERYGLRSQFNIFPEASIPEIYSYAQRITTRAGSAILWDQRTLHGSQPNNSDRPRFAQFFKMFPADHPSMTSERSENRRKAILKKLSKVQIDPNTDLTELGRKLFGLC